MIFINFYQKFIYLISLSDRKFNVKFFYKRIQMIDTFVIHKVALSIKLGDNQHTISDRMDII